MVPGSHPFLALPPHPRTKCCSTRHVHGSARIPHSCWGPSTIFHHMAHRPSASSHGKYQDNQTCLAVIHVTICLGFPLFECCNTQPDSQNISGLLLSKFLNLNKHKRPNSDLGSICTNPICDIKWSRMNQCKHGVWHRVFTLIYGVHLAAPNQGEPGLSTVFKQ